MARTRFLPPSLSPSLSSRSRQLTQLLPALPLLILALAPAPALALPFPAPTGAAPAPGALGPETDGEASQRVLGSSVVTSVSVIMDLGTGTRVQSPVGDEAAAAAEGPVVSGPAHAPPPVPPHLPKPRPGERIPAVASPAALLHPDRYEFYTFDEAGDLVRRFMTIAQIQSMIAGGDGSPSSLNGLGGLPLGEGRIPAGNSPAGDAPPPPPPPAPLGVLPTVADHQSGSGPTAAGVREVVDRVQNVLRSELEASKRRPTPPAPLAPQAPPQQPTAPLAADPGEPPHGAWSVLLPAMRPAATSSSTSAATAITTTTSERVITTESSTTTKESSSETAPTTQEQSTDTDPPALRESPATAPASTTTPSAPAAPEVITEASVSASFSSGSHPSDDSSEGYSASSSSSEESSDNSSSESDESPEISTEPQQSPVQHAPTLSQPQPPSSEPDKDSSDSSTTPEPASQTPMLLTVIEPSSETPMLIPVVEPSSPTPNDSQDSGLSRPIVVADTTPAEDFEIPVQPTIQIDVEPLSAAATAVPTISQQPYSTPPPPTTTTTENAIEVETTTNEEPKTPIPSAPTLFLGLLPPFPDPLDDGPSMPDDIPLIFSQSATPSDPPITTYRPSYPTGPAKTSPTDVVRSTEMPEETPTTPKETETTPEETTTTTKEPLKETHDSTKISETPAEQDVAPATEESNDTEPAENDASQLKNVYSGAPTTTTQTNDFSSDGLTTIKILPYSSIPETTPATINQEELDISQEIADSLSSLLSQVADQATTIVDPSASGVTKQDTLSTAVNEDWDKTTTPLHKEQTTTASPASLTPSITSAETTLAVSEETIFASDAAESSTPVSEAQIILAEQATTIVSPSPAEHENKIAQRPVTVALVELAPVYRPTSTKPKPSTTTTTESVPEATDKTMHLVGSDEEDDKAEEIEKDIEKESEDEKENDALVKRQEEIDAKLGEPATTESEEEETKKTDITTPKPSSSTPFKIVVQDSPIVYEDEETFNSYTAPQTSSPTPFSTTTTSAASTTRVSPTSTPASPTTTPVEPSRAATTTGSHATTTTSQAPTTAAPTTTSSAPSTTPSAPTTRAAPTTITLASEPTTPSSTPEITPPPKDMITTPATKLLPPENLNMGSDKEGTDMVNNSQEDEDTQSHKDTSPLEEKASPEEKSEPISPLEDTPAAKNEPTTTPVNLNNELLSSSTITKSQITTTSASKDIEKTTLPPSDSAEVSATDSYNTRYEETPIVDDVLSTADVAPVTTIKDGATTEEMESSTKSNEILKKDSSSTTQKNEDTTVEIEKGAMPDVSPSSTPKPDDQAAENKKDTTESTDVPTTPNEGSPDQNVQPEEKLTTAPKESTRPAEISHPAETTAVPSSTEESPEVSTVLPDSDEPGNTDAPEALLTEATETTAPSVTTQKQPETVFPVFKPSTTKAPPVETEKPTETVFPVFKGHSTPAITMPVDAATSTSATEKISDTSAPQTEKPGTTSAPDTEKAPGSTESLTEIPSETTESQTVKPADSSVPHSDNAPDTPAPETEKPEDTTAPQTEKPAETSAPERAKPAEKITTTTVVSPTESSPENPSTQEPIESPNTTEEDDDSVVMEPAQATTQGPATPTPEDRFEASSSSPVLTKIGQGPSPALESDDGSPEDAVVVLITRPPAPAPLPASHLGVKDSAHDVRPRPVPVPTLHFNPVSSPAPASTSAPQVPVFVPQQRPTHFHSPQPSRPEPPADEQVAVALPPAPAENLGLEASTASLGSDVRRFAALCNELAFRMWGAVTVRGLHSGRSVVMSPLGVTSTLAMVFLGARGPTSGQMNDVLRLDDMVTFNPHQVFRNVTESVVLGRHPGIATAAFVRQLYSDRSKGRLLDFYKERAQQFYDAHVEEVDFSVIGDVVRRRTNLLVKRQTRGRVPEYLRGAHVMLHPPLAAFGANIFQTECSSASLEGRDGEMYFTVLPGSRQRRLVLVPAAVWRSGFLAGYDPLLDCTAAAVGDASSLVSVIFLLPGQQGALAPGDGVAALERRLTEPSFRRGAWARVLRSLAPRPGLELQLPRFSHRSLLNVTAALQRMGLKDLFNAERADLRGLNGVANDLHLSDIVQVNTFSTCADGGASGMRQHAEVYPAGRAGRGDLSGIPLALRPRQGRDPEPQLQQQLLPPPRLRFDRPFLYAVRHNPTGFLLHMGRFNPHLLH